MPRDPNRNVYVTIGLPRDSQTYQALLADASETGLTVAQLMAVRLADLYRLGAQRVLTQTQAQLAWPASEDAVSGAQTRGAHRSGLAGDERAPLTRDLETRARDAAAAWACDDEG